MPTEDDVIRIQLEIEDAEKADDLRAAIGLLEQKLGSLYQQFRGHPDDFRKATEQDAAKLADLRAQLDQVANASRRQAEAQKQAAREARDARIQAAKQAAQEEIQAARMAADVIIDAANEELAARTRAAGPAAAAGGKGGFNPSALLEFSRALEDLQYGVAGAVNNIPGLVTQLGGSAGLAGAASLAAIAISQLVNHWDDLSKAIGLSPFEPPIDGLTRMEGELKKAQDEMDKLGKSTGLTFAELQKFTEAQATVKALTEKLKDQKAVDASLEGKSEAEQKRGEAFRKALDESNGPVAHNDYKAALAEQKDSNGQVYNFKQEKLTNFDDAFRENWAEALEGNQRAIKSIGDALPEGNQFRENIGKFDPKRAEEAKEDRAGARADDKDLQADIRDAEKHADEVGHAYDKKVADISKPLQDRFNAVTGGGGRIDEAATRSRLKSLGYSDADAEKYARPVLDALRQGFNADVRERASQKGMTFDEAGKDLLADFTRKQADAKESADERGRRDRAKDLDKRLAGTGVDDRARAELARRTAAGASPDEAARATAEALSQELQATNLGKDDADKAARERVDAVAGRLGDDMVRGQFDGQRGDKGLSHYAAADFTNRVEASGLEAQQKETNSLLKSSNDKLDQLIRKSNVAVMGP